MRVSSLMSLMGCLVVASAGTAHLTAAAAKTAPITVSIGGLNCSTPLGADTFDARSWSWGAANVTSTTGGSGSGVGKAVVDELQLTRVADACSPALLSGVMTGKIFTTVTLSQYDLAGVLKATVVLNNAFLTNWHIGGTNTSAEALEEVSLTFEKFTLTDLSSGAKFCYDVPLQKVC